MSADQHPAWHAATPLARRADPETVRTDLTVVGGGMAGCVAAIAAARRGLSVALVHDRPVLGGNASSEVRVSIAGAACGKFNRYAREGGIVEELLLENRYRNTDGNAHLWDALLLDFVRAEAPNLRLFLNTPVTEVDLADRRTVRAVVGRQQMSERSWRFESPRFIDASGDGVIAAWAGAAFRQGREARSEYDESWAPDVADARTLGASITFSTKDAGYPVAFHPPRFARDFKAAPPRVLVERADPRRRRGCFWWIEYGGDLDGIADNEQIRDELLAIVYGTWDFIKNSGRFVGVENLQLEWVGSVPGKRESRRFIGDYVLTEHDVVEQRQHLDAVAHGGLSIDLHPPRGFYDDSGEASRHWHLKGPYSIPYRCLYTRDLDNLFLAGRIVSASHVAFGTLRVMMTLAAMGQVVGTAAALCGRYGLTPRALGEQHVDQLQQALLRDDQWIIGVPNRDPDDLARGARVTASSVQPYRLDEGNLGEGNLDEGDFEHPLDEDLGIHLTAPERLERVWLRCAAERSTRLEVEVWSEDRPENYAFGERVGERVVAVPAGRHWIEIPVGVGGAPGQGAFLVLGAAPDVRIVGVRRLMTGLIACPRQEPDDASRGWRFEWRPANWVPCLRVEPEMPVYAAQNVVDGYSRPWGGPRCWLSRPLQAGRPEWIELDLGAEYQIGQVQLAFNTNLTPWYDEFQNLHPAPSAAIAETVKEYAVLVGRGGNYHEVARVSGNYQRVRRHTFEPTLGDRVRVVVSTTNGAPAAEIFEIRVYPG
ncbi:MAG: FAD-dependent oxidoreductase [Chloroflexi bacterium]|nr:FAD-dependent oxidoreductase [Chloroflexota bacterium]